VEAKIKEEEVSRGSLYERLTWHYRSAAQVKAGVVWVTVPIF